MVIRVSGYPGSGKTTLCKRLAEALGYQYHYAGGIFREMAKEKGVSIEDFYKALANDPATESEVDKRNIEIMASHDNLIMEGRMTPFLPCPFKTFNILLMVSPEESAHRGILRPENAGRSLDEMQKQTEERIAAEKKHYKALHNVDDHFGASHYNLVIDTTSLSPDQVFEKVTTAIQHPHTS